MPKISATKYVVNAGWDDAPHLDKRTKETMLSAIPPWMRPARSKGVPTKGAGAIYPIDREQIAVDPFEIPPSWPRGYGLDVGWNWTAAMWFAKDPNTQIYYGYTEHKMGLEKPIIHAQAIKARGKWIPGCIDPSANNRKPDDGERLMEMYQELGLDLVKAENSVDTGIIDVWQKLAFGQLKVFSSCLYWFAEFDHYRRDENGKIVKKNDHLMDCTRYFFNTLTGAMKLPPLKRMIDAGGAGVDPAGYD